MEVASQTPFLDSPLPSAGCRFHPPLFRIMISYVISGEKAFIECGVCCDGFHEAACGNNFVNTRYYTMVQTRYFYHVPKLRCTWSRKNVTDCSVLWGQKFSTLNLLHLFHTFRGHLLLVNCKSRQATGNYWPRLRAKILLSGCDCQQWHQSAIKWRSLSHPQAHPPATSGPSEEERGSW